MSLDPYSAWKGWQADTFGHIAPDQRDLYEAELRPRLKAGHRVLEIGFGNGALLSWSRELGLDYWGVEQNPVLLARGQQAGARVAPSVEALDLPPGSLDAVIAIDVLEHLSKADLQALLRQLRTAVRADGLLIARFPNGDSPLSMPYQNGDLTHVTAIGSRMLRQLAGLTGWQVQSYAAQRPARQGLGLRARCALALGHGLRRLLESLLSKLYLSGQRWVLAPNCIAVLIAR